MTYEEALEFIHGVNWTFCKPGLDRIRELCGKLGDPQDKLKFIHVAGTNGKGSTCAMLANVLKCAGYRTGLYTSPYVLRFNERMQMDGVPISDEKLARLCKVVKPIADAMTDKPTEFELITAVAFLYFLEEGADVVVLEVGMGGRLDATNVIKTPLVSVITGIALDHTAFLGNTVEEIAREKAGIIRQGVPVLYGGDDESAARVISEHAAKVGAEYYRTDYSLLGIKSATLDGCEFDYRDIKSIKTRLPGLYQPKNACIVLDAVSLVRRAGISIPEDAVREGIETAKWQARFEILRKSDPMIIFDGAHNPQGIDASVESVKRYFTKKVHIVSGVLKDKDYRYIARRLSEIAEVATTITPDNARALDGAKYAEILRAEGVDAQEEKSVYDALETAIKKAKNATRPLICLGSLYTYCEVVAALEKINTKENGGL